MTEPIRLLLPIPPSVNNAYLNMRGRGRIISPAYRRWSTEAGWTVRAAKCRSIPGPYRLAVYLPERMRGDVDNRLKAVCDLLVNLGITADDSRARSVLAERMEGIDIDKCLVVIEAVAETCDAA